MTEAGIARAPATIVRRAETLLRMDRHEVEAAWRGYCHAPGSQGKHDTVVADTRMRPGCDWPTFAAYGAGRWLTFG